MTEPTGVTHCPVTGEADDRTARKRTALNVGMGFLSRVLAAPDRTEEILAEADRALAEAGVDGPLAALICRDIALGAILHRPTVHALLNPVTGARPVRARSRLPFYVDGYYFTRPLPEPLHSVFVELADGGLLLAMREFPELFRTPAPARADIQDPLLRAAIAAQGRLPLQPWEAQAGMTEHQRLLKLVVGSIVDDVFSAVAIVVGAEQSLLDDLPNARATILANLPALRLPALIDRENLVRIWKLRAPFNTDDGRMSGIPVIERTGDRFTYPGAASGKSLCVGMYPVTEPREAFDGIGGYPAFLRHMGPNVKELDDGTVLYRLADVDLANVCALAERYWRSGERLAPEGTFEPPQRPTSTDESDHWPILF